MIYQNTVTGRFLSRPNRFIAQVEVDGKETVCHVKNTGRCQELLRSGSTVILQRSLNPARKTAYDLIAVYKGERLINMDSQVPNKVVEEWLRGGNAFPTLTKLQPECTFGSSRFDFYLETEERRIFVEVKGVTLEEDGVVLFPDAPTQRGIKHLRELTEAVRQGYEAYVFFVIQMEDCRYFTPNRATHPAFALALEEAEQSGVRLCAFNCRVRENQLSLKDPVPILLHP